VAVLPDLAERAVVGGRVDGEGPGVGHRPGPGLEPLGAVFDEEKHSLEVCLQALDQKLEECSVCIADYRRLHLKLTNMHQKLVQLGAQPNGLPPPLPVQSIEEVIAWRLGELKNHSRL